MTFQGGPYKLGQSFGPYVLEAYLGSGAFKSVKARAPAFANTARYAGLPMPKGVLLVGVPGCGKSLSTRALAGPRRGERVWNSACDTASACSPHCGHLVGHLTTAVSKPSSVRSPRWPKEPPGSMFPGTPGTRKP